MSCAPHPRMASQPRPKGAQAGAATEDDEGQAPRSPRYGPKVVAALIFCWAVLGMLAGKQWAPILGELVAILRRFGERDIDEDTATLLAGMSAPLTMRCLDRHRLRLRLDAGPQRAQQGRKWVLAALDDIAKVDAVPDPGCRQRHWIGVHQPSPAGMLRERQITCTRSRPGNKNDGCHVEQRKLGHRPDRDGYHRDDRSRTAAAQQDLGTAVEADELLLPAAELVSKVRGAPR
jgi:hypothetical protein